MIEYSIRALEISFDLPVRYERFAGFGTGRPVGNGESPTLVPCEPGVFSALSDYRSVVLASGNGLSNRVPAARTD
ncbi:MAG: hypothetical protein ABEJ26_12310 [Halosimplex sp.]